MPRSNNPPWARDELILALDAYLHCSGNPPGKTSKEIADLSALLNRIGSSLGTRSEATYRNPNGVYMKLMNFRRFDPAFTSTGRVGLQRGNKDEGGVWADFSDDPTRLAAVAAAIRANVVTPETVTAESADDEPYDQDAPEGRVLSRLHRVRERSRKLVEARKRRALAEHGTLACEVCGFDFKVTYGPRGDGFIECHHTVPLQSLTPGHRTNLGDLALLCANCHRMIHASRPWLTIEALRQSLQATLNQQYRA